MSQAIAANLSQNDLEKAAQAIANADSLVIGAGAGMGVDSGLPDFRGQQGFWRAYPALAEAGVDFTEIANPAAFSILPQMAWGFYGHRFNLYRRIKPHAGFGLLNKIGSRMANGYQVFTSNVDGHFTKAGFDENRIAECHGAINYLQCSGPCHQDIWPAGDLKLLTDDENCLATSPLPACPKCRQVARPNILMFGDFNWLSKRSNEQTRRMDENLTKMQKPVVIECGAGTAIPTVRRFCESVEATLIRINPREFEVPRTQDIGLACGALAGLEAIDRQLQATGFYA